VDVCPYDALRCGPDFELAHVSRKEPMIDLIAIAAVDRETEMTYVRRERDWLERAIASGRDVGPRQLPVLPPSLAGSGIGSATAPTGDPRNGHNGHGPGAGGVAGHGHNR
jgi:hypothetical protein